MEIQKPIKVINNDVVSERLSTASEGIVGEDVFGVPGPNG